MSRLKTKLIATSIWVKHHTRMHVVVTALVLGAGLCATAYYWNNLRQGVQADMRTAYSRQVREVSKNAAARLGIYENFLRASAGLFRIHSGLTQAEWDEFHQPYNIRAKYPDIEGIGVSRYLTRDEVPDYLDRRYAQGDAAFTIFPAGDRDVYVPVTFNAQYTGNTGKSRGYDGYTNPIRRTAMDRAIDTGKPSMTGKVTLVSESRPGRASFLLYLPIYDESKPVSTVAERQAAITGFSYVAVDFKTLIDSVLDFDHSPNLGIKLTDDASGNKDDFVYQSEGYNTILGENGAINDMQPIQLYGHRYTVSFAASPGLLSERERQLPGQALWRGILTSVFFASMVWYLVTDRERKYARQKQEEVQTAKDDLLSLASHQLRTPATVVKQYVGMLLQGYAGDLTEQQLDMLSNAYESNERQLEIINQLLYVARLDAGRIKLKTEKVDVSRLLRSIANEQKQIAAERQQEIILKQPKRSLWIEVDPHYMRMALENLLSNAIKYTPEKGTITISTRRAHGRALIRVADNGVGISPEAQARVFEKFTRVENELSNDVNGSGVGLYLTNQIVSLHNGNIELLSEPGKGSTFTIVLPFTYEPPEEIPT